MVSEITALDTLLYQIGPGQLRLERSADRLQVEPDRLAQLLALYAASGAIVSSAVQVCPQCDQVVDRDETGRFPCDLCDGYYALNETESEVVYFVSSASETSQSRERIKIMETKFKTPDQASPFELARIAPWDHTLASTDITVESATLGDYEQSRIWDLLERYGICLFRMGAQSADDAVVFELAKFIGPPTEEQNLFRGQLKLIQPTAEGRVNSGDTAKDLGLHVDGTQHEQQPMALIFQYITDAKLGAQSVFVDAERVLFDIDEPQRHRIMSDLARPDAAIFSKSGMKYTGPIFSISALGTVSCRIRLDEVIQVHPDCREHYDFLSERFNQEKYRLSFRPREGDVIVFDNWRVLHARDEVFGRCVRAHNRMWISSMKANLKSKHWLGVRGLRVEDVAAIGRQNGIR